MDKVISPQISQLLNNETRESVAIIDANDNWVGVLISKDEYQLLKATADLASNPENYIELIDRHQQIMSGEFYATEKTEPLEDVFGYSSKYLNLDT